VLSEDKRLFGDMLMPDGALGGGVNEPLMFPTDVAFGSYANA
jgi:hypothetical protein